MKAIIYAGIGLFSAASVYGVIDYYGAKKQGTLNNLYTEEAPQAITEAAAETKSAAATAVLNNTAEKNAAPVKKQAVAKVKKAKKEKRYVKFSDFSRGAIIREPMPVETETVPAPAAAEAPVAAPAVVPTAAPAAVPVEKPEEKKETITAQPEKREPVSLKMFSRAPLKKSVKRAAQPEKVKEIKNK